MFLRTATAGQRRISVAGTEHQKRYRLITDAANRRSSSILPPVHNFHQSRISPIFEESSPNLSSKCFSENLHIHNIREKSVKLIPHIKPRLTFKLNGGQTFQTFESTLDYFPDTLLGNKANRDKFYDPKIKEYVINRCHHCFGTILFYYQSKGILSRPLDIDRDIFLKEMEFYQIKEILDLRHSKELKLQEEEENNKLLPKGYIRQYIWKILDYHEHTNISKMCFYINLMTSLLAIIVFCLETEPRFKGAAIWYDIETGVNVVFTIDYALRLFSAPSPKKFLVSASGIVDVIVIFPYYFNILLRVTGATKILPLSLFTLLRVLRVFKLTRFNEGLRILIMTIYESFSHLRSLFACIGIVTLLFATVLFYIESSDSDPDSENFKSIPDSFWYTVITATAVGYGDMYPKTVLGKIVGSILASVGLLLFCLPTPMLVNKFVECYYLRVTLSEIVDPHRKEVTRRMRETFL